VLGIVLLLQLTVAVSGPATSPEYLAVRVADAAGLFAREGLAVTLRSTRAESGAAEALAQGQADLAATSLEAVLRFAHRPGAALPRLLLGLTAAPPVALMVPEVHKGAVATVAHLAQRRIGFTSPGGPEHTWLQAVLARAGLGPAQVELVALGTRGLFTSLEAGEVHAGLVAEPLVSRLVHDRGASVLVDLRTPAAAERALGVPTVNAAVFVRGDRRPRDADLAAFARAVLAAGRLIRTEAPDALAARLPREVQALGTESEAWLAGARAAALPDGLVAPEAVRHTLAIARAHLPLPVTLRIPGPDALLHQEPVRRALRSRRPR
jgi:NitT/TauT family transport system substrate-binding protein